MLSQSNVRQRTPLFAALLLLAAVALSFLLAGQALAQTPETPATTITLGNNLNYVSPGVLATAYRQAQWEEGNDPLPGVTVYVFHSETDTAFSAAITAAGGSSAGTDRWTIPASGVAAILGRDGVISVETRPEPAVAASDQRLGRLADAVLAKEAGVPDAEAALYSYISGQNRVGVEIIAPSAAIETQVRAWLASIPVAVAGDTMPDSYIFWAMIPLEQVRPLLQAHTAIEVDSYPLRLMGLPMLRSQWSKEQRTAASDFAAGLAPRASGRPARDTTRHHLVSKTDLALRRTYHGLTGYPYNRAVADASKIKVGVIDWSFSGFKTNPRLPAITTTTPANPNLTGANAFCQVGSEGIWDAPMRENPCEINIGVPVVSNRDIDHGNQVAELVLDMAPQAKLYFAQANSPRQLKKAADWLTGKGVHVIVHAGGWAFDGPGSGWTPMTAERTTGNLSNHNSPRHYYPGATATMKATVEAGNRPIWVNAVGNAEMQTLWVSGVNVIQSGTNRGKLELGGTGDPCVDIEYPGASLAMVSMRWADNWNSPVHNMEFSLHTVTGEGTNRRVAATPFLTSNTTADLRPWPVEAASLFLGGGRTACVKIFKGTIPSGVITAPAWTQLQFLTSEPESNFDFPGRIDEAGRSVATPAESDHANLLAVAAINFKQYVTDHGRLGDRADETILFSSSYGLVMPPNTTDTRTTLPNRQKPDVVAASNLITQLSNDSADHNRFSGSSAATATTGGVAVVAMQYFRDIYGSTTGFNGSDIAEFLKDNAISPGANEVRRKGSGRVHLPCPATRLTLPQAGRSISRPGTIATSDCLSTRQTRGNGSFSDYYSFRVGTASRLMVEVEDTNPRTSTILNTYAYVTQGLGNGGEVEAFNDDRPSGQTGGKATDSKLVTEVLDAGMYTIEVTSPDRTTGGYRLKVKVLCTGGCSTDTASLTASPHNRLMVSGPHRKYTVNSTVPVKVVVNPGTQKALVSLSKPATTTRPCNPRNNQTLNLMPGESFYMGACSFGVARLELRSSENDTELYGRNFNLLARTGAYLSPAPASSGLEASGRWKAVRVFVPVTGSLTIHPGASDVRSYPDVATAGNAVITKRANAAHPCPATPATRRINVRNGETVYIAACGTGEARVALGTRSSDWNYYVYYIPAPAQSSIPAPQDLRLTASASSLRAVWNAVTGAPKYKVQWKSGTEEFSSTREATVSGTTKTLQLSRGNTYTVRVQAVFNNTGGLWSSHATATIGSAALPVPSAPAITTPVVTGNSSAFIDWPTVANASSYDVQWRKPPNEEFSFLRQESATFSRYYLEGIDTNTSYEFQARGRNGTGLGAWSTAVSATTRDGRTTCLKPGRLRVTRFAADQAYIWWANPGNGLTVNNRKLTIEKFVGGAWVQERYINAGLYAF